jgi:4-alpha-glucanotransferase
LTVASSGAITGDLRRLARLYSVQTEYVDVAKTRRQAVPEALLAVLRALGAPVEHDRDIRSAIAERESEVEAVLIDPVIVAWDGVLPDLSVPEGTRVTMFLEDGHDASNGRSRRRLPPGYHTLVAEHRSRRAEALVISAPKRAYAGELGETRGWGTFIPLYALQSEGSWGSGDFTELRRLSGWTADLGGRAVSTLPLFAAFLDEPFQPSPYSPASRLFWNEFYLDVAAAPEFESSRAAQAIVGSQEFQEQLGELRGAPEVSYKRVMELKRRVLAVLAEQCFETPGRARELKDFVRQRPEAEDYARFRAMVERRREPWWEWPKALRGGRVSGADYEQGAYRYHLYVQFLAHEQLSELHDAASDRGVRLFFDLPLGVDPMSYDAWREGGAFAEGLTLGAPPDAFFTRGQDWGIAPPHPARAREQGYRYFRSVLGNVLRYAGALRIDHIMGLHRLYCVPHGMDASDGVYIRYPADELYAILSLESHRCKALISGEDLGTVPSYVHDAMSRHGIQRTYVLQYELDSTNKEPIPEPRRSSVASLNTHDMPPFAAFWEGLDIEDRLDLGLMKEKQAEYERQDRKSVRESVIAELRKRGLITGGGAELEDVLRALLLVVAGSRASLVLVNLEDLWLEEHPQNVPGTTDERANWRRKARYTLEEMQGENATSSLLRQIGESRRMRHVGRRN